MLLAIDIGNTHTVLGLFRESSVQSDWRISTCRNATADEVGVMLGGLFRDAGFDHGALRGSIVSSVVPDLNGPYREAIQRYLNLDPLFVGPGVKTGLPILYENPHQVGADRIVNSVAAMDQFGAPVIVLDFGTATTFDVVGPAGEYLGGVISPGLGASAEALFSRAARLPRVDLRRPGCVIGRNTENSIQSGLYFGYVALVEGLLARIREELGHEAPVVATGGLVSILEPEMSFLTATVPGLTLHGLRLIWERNRS